LWNCLSVYSVISPRLFSKARGYTRRRAEVRICLLLETWRRRGGLRIELDLMKIDPEMVEIAWMKCDDSGRTIIETNVEETRCD